MNKGIRLIKGALGVIMTLEASVAVCKNKNQMSHFIWSALIQQDRASVFPNVTHWCVWCDVKAG